MSFRSPWMLLSLAAVPAAVAAYVSSYHRRSGRASRLASQGLVITAASAQVRWRRHIPFGLFVAALAVLAVALARPSMAVSTPRREGTVILAFDVSNSMKADDIKPTRIEAARTAARAFVDRQPSKIRIGVVAFGDGAVLVQSPTTTQANVVGAINRLSLGGGTSIGQGLIASLSAIAGKPVTIDEEALSSDAGKVDIGYYGSATVVLLSDGENRSRPDPVSVSEVASVAGVTVHTIGIGTEDGAVVQVEGFNVATALDKELLEKVADVTDGRYYEAKDAAALNEIYKAIDLDFKVVSERSEVTGLFTAAGALLLLAGALLSVLWFGRVV